MSQTSALTTAINVFASPAEAFAAVRERSTFFLPMLLVCLAAAAVNSLYLLEVDIGWLTEEQLRAQRFIDLTDAQIADMANAAAERGPGLAVAQSVIAVFIVVPVILLIQALYLKIVSVLRKDQIRYRQWLSLASWMSLPAILGSVATAVYILTSDVSLVSQTGINPISFANLLQIDLSDANALVRGVSNASIMNVWSLILLILGYRTIAGTGMGTALTVVLAPVVLISGIVFALT